MELKHFIKVPDELVDRARGSCRTYLENFCGHCSGEKILPLLKKQIEKDELYPTAQKKVPYLEASTGPFRYVKSMKGFFATVKFDKVLSYDRNKGLIIFENKADHYFFVVQSPKSIKGFDYGIEIQRGAKTLWGVGCLNEHHLRDWEDSFLMNPPLRRRNGLRQDLSDALKDMRELGEDRRVLGCMYKKKIESLKEEEAEYLVERPVKRQRKDSKKEEMAQ